MEPGEDTGSRAGTSWAWRKEEAGQRTAIHPENLSPCKGKPHRGQASESSWEVGTGKRRDQQGWRNTRSVHQCSWKWWRMADLLLYLFMHTWGIRGWCRDWVGRGQQRSSRWEGDCLGRKTSRWTRLLNNSHKNASSSLSHHYSPISWRDMGIMMNQRKHNPLR